MKASILDKRDKEAQARIIASVTRLSKKHGLPAELLNRLSVHDRDPNVKAMLHREGIADILEAVTATAKESEKSADEAEEHLASLQAERDFLLRENTLLKGEKESDLPVDFPGRFELILAGILTTAEVSALSTEELLAIPGIGHATFDKIVQYRAAPEPQNKKAAPKPGADAPMSAGKSAK